MQGTVLKVAEPGGEGLILGDDGVQYTYTPMGWRVPTTRAFSGMKVDFETRGSHAVGVYPLPGQTPPPPPPIPTPVVPSAPEYQQPGAPPPPLPPVAPGPSQYQQPGAPPPAPANPPPAYPGSYQQPGAPPPYQGGPVGAVPPPSPANAEPQIDVGKIIAGIGWMFLLSILLSCLPIIGGMIGGFVGGRKSGNFANAGIGAGIVALVIGGAWFLLLSVALDATESAITDLPFVGGMIMNSFIGDVFEKGAILGAAIILALNSPTLLMMLLGGATAKK